MPTMILDDLLALHSQMSLLGTSSARTTAALSRSEVVHKLNSSDKSDKMAAVEYLLSVVESGMSSNLTTEEISQHLQKAFPPFCSDPDVMRVASKAIGLIVANNEDFQVQNNYFRMEADRALEWLRYAKERHAAVLVLKELAGHLPGEFADYVLRAQSLESPTTTSGQVDSVVFFELLFAAVLDAKIGVRLDGASALETCVAVASDCDVHIRSAIWFAIFKQIGRGLDGKEDGIHGALLALNVVALYPTQILEFALSGREKHQTLIAAYNQALKHVNGKGLLLKTAVEIFPALVNSLPLTEVKRDTAAKASTLAQEFWQDVKAFHQNVRSHLKELVSNFRLISKETTRTSIFIALGSLARDQSNLMDLHMRATYAQVRVTLEAKRDSKRSDPCIEAALDCVRDLFAAYKEKVAKLDKFDEMIGLMLNQPLSESLVQALQALVDNIKTWRRIANAHILDELCIAIREFVKQCSPDQVISSDDRILLVLETLGSFRFGSGPDAPSHGTLLEFANEFVSPLFFLNPNEQLRKAAVVCCAQLLQLATSDKGSAHLPKPGELIRVKPSAATAAAQQFATSLLSQMLKMSLSDVSPANRLATLRGLNFPGLYNYLARTENIQMLFVLLNDLIVDIKVAAIETLGALVPLRSGMITARVRMVVSDILSELQTGDESSNKTNLVLLSHLIRNVPPGVRPHAATIMTVLLPMLDNQGCRLHALQTCSELAGVAGAQMKMHIDVLMPVILWALKHPFRSHKRIAISALQRLAQGANYVIKPYLEHTELMQILLRTLAAEQTAARGSARKSQSTTGDSVATKRKGPPFRDHILRVIGALGAPDPDHFKRMSGQDVQQRKPKYSAPGHLIDPLVLHELKRSGSEDFATVSTLNALMRIANQPGLAAHHEQVLAVIVLIHKYRTKACSRFLEQIVLSCNVVVHEAFQGQRAWDALLRKFAPLVLRSKSDIEPHLPPVITLVVQLWRNLVADVCKGDSDPRFGAILTVVEAMAKATGPTFRQHVPQFIPLIKEVFERDQSYQRKPTSSLLRLLAVFGESLDGWLHVLIPKVAVFFTSKENPLSVRSEALVTTRRLGIVLHLQEFAPSLVCCLAKVLDDPDEAERLALEQKAMGVLSVLVTHMGSDYLRLGFLKQLNQVIRRRRTQHFEYSRIVRCLITKTPFPEIEHKDHTTGVGESIDDTREPVLELRAAQLRQAWNANHSGQWSDWLIRLGRTLLQESPDVALRCCTQLAAAYPPLAQELFLVSFVSCWGELFDEDREDFQTQATIIFLHKRDEARKVKEVLLDVVELMEYMKKGTISFENRNFLLSQQSEAVGQFSRALRYKECEYYALKADEARPRTESVMSGRDRSTSASSYVNPPERMNSTDRAQAHATLQKQRMRNCFEDLLRINNALQLSSSASGLLEFAHAVQLGPDRSTEGQWLEKLGRWDEALGLYREAATLDQMGEIRCLRALGKWDELFERVDLLRSSSEEQDQAQFSDVIEAACSAAFATGKWNRLERWTEFLQQDTFERFFYLGIVALHRDEVKSVEDCVHKCRSLINIASKTMSFDVYDRMYDKVISLQLLTEMEEILSFKRNHHDTETQQSLKETWRSRLHGSKRSSTVWDKVLQLRSMVLPPSTDALQEYLTLSDICLEEGKHDESGKALGRLLSIDAKPNVEDIVANGLAGNNPDVVYRLILQTWKAGGEQAKPNAMKLMEEFMGQYDLDQKLHARCCYTLASWRFQELEASGRKLEPKELAPIIEEFECATAADRELGPAWHSWAFLNFQAATWWHNPDHQASEEDIVSASKYAAHAIDGFFKSISLNPGNSQQDALRLLRIWFKYGEHQEVNAAIASGRAAVSLDTWLPLIQQFIARLDHPEVTVQESIQQVLLELGKLHPQASVMPLTVAKQSQDPKRADIANKLLSQMRAHSPELVDQAIMVGEELIRAGVLWHERWFTDLQDASKLMYEQQDPDAMLERLKHLHEDLQNPQTPREIAFLQSFGALLQNAKEWTDRYNRTRAIVDIHAAWSFYLKAFRRLERLLNKLTSVDLQSVSPALIKAKNLCLAVPGTYKSNAAVVRIASFEPTMDVIMSKQRPRKLVIVGDDGVHYKFLLKGHEDPRMDERVMSFFGLINSLLTSNRATSKQHLSILRYSITPLSPSSGLIEWVDHCDTLHDLLKQHRKISGVPMHEEHMRIRRIAPLAKDNRNLDSPYYSLTTMQRTEALMHGIASVDGDDLAQMMWLSSPDCEAWLDRRTTYTRSVAVMSMVGHILGLGDRHPSNIMIQRDSGKALHIDFGDCFDVAQTRAKYPEKIPFRLTRMMVRAMEVSGIEGTYRTTCEHVMAVLRENKDSLLALLDAFVDDPLLHWRLDAQAEVKQHAFDIEDNLLSRQDTIGNEYTPDTEQPVEPVQRMSIEYNRLAVESIQRVEHKLTGREFVNHKTAGGKQKALPVKKQVDRLIREATSPVNWSQHYLGWCPFW